MLGNVKTFLWRTLCVQGRRSRACRSVFGILFTAILFYLVAHSHKRPTPVSKDSGTVNVNSAFMPPEVMHIVYAPKSDYNDELMRAVANEIARRLKATEALSKWHGLLFSPDVSAIQVRANSKCGRLRGSCAPYKTTEEWNREGVSMLACGAKKSG